MKYLIVEDFSGQPVCFLFPRRVDHGDMRDQLPYGRVISAGFAELDDGRFLCSGGSQELKVTARPDEDAALLAEALRHRSDA
ncbi:MAG TPA: hypothetical protein H9962_03995 [Candidatus Mailhella merdigallinarum]|uniref:Uncharacterized protein n=1 Tax=Candidatus Mailhella merdigallinarum TaxID=2838658 RepID=A0A9D2HDB6_9BACT|nr:hypothetical protein [Desulfovibrionaceae bacterium]PWM67156.1 MAG: hypothetical protein DBX67_08090 [Desulfovibrionaceae bacterium]PWM68458.1 MAG: hypothetical protein DBX67_05910 [Desulfovibrionaceae bacterium]HJA08337.1 hypothetical protein [Candidatus Mailhella merdigallinarum]